MSTDTRLGQGIHHEILLWSQDLPDWQRDALRRIVEYGRLSDADITELSAACRSANGLSEECVPELHPLAAEHVPTGANSSCKVTLCSISEAENVNAIDFKQSIPFAPAGLTVVFGYNGSGKSGYGRVLRRACRARSKGNAILPNVLQNSSGSGPASAVITYALDDVEQPPAQWIDGQRAIDPLGAVSFFDSECASIHVREKNDIAFVPFGIDVLPSLAAGCKKVQEKLDSERKQLEAINPPFLRSPHATGSTRVGVALRGLKASTTVNSLELLAALSDRELLRLKEIPVQLAADPQKLANELRTQAGRIESLRSTLASADRALSDEAIAAIKSLADDSIKKAKAVQVTAQTNFANDPLPNIGEQIWRQLWDAARRYSAVSFPAREFPVTGDDAVCVLCQQQLADDAKDRLCRFEQFVRDDSAQQAAKSKEALQSAVRKVQGLDLLGDAIKEQMKDVRSNDNELLAKVRQQLATLIRRLRAIGKAQESGVWDFALPGTIENSDEKLLTLVSSINARAADVEKSADLTGRQQIEEELAELRAREWLASVLGDVKEHLDRLVWIDKLLKAAKETRTNRVTARSKELAKKHVTDQLRDTFATEIRKMQQGVRRLNVELVATDGAFGSSYYRVQLIGASKVDIGAIVSEGEHRCIALAGFLAELATEPCKSTIVLDDPVTSLDHHWRDCFAARLVQEAVDRQVVIFTHDIVFLYDLSSYAEDNGVNMRVLHVNAGKFNAGLVEHELPWDAKSVPDRIDKLEKEIRSAKSFYDDMKNEEYKSQIESIYGRLRATVEKIVEEQLFCRVVVRHRDYINLKDLRKVSAIRDDHCIRIKALFDRCCDITDAHYRSPSRGYSVPTPTDALADVAELQRIVTDVKAEQKTV